MKIQIINIMIILLKIYFPTYTHMFGYYINFNGLCLEITHYIQHMYIVLDSQIKRIRVFIDMCRVSVPEAVFHIYSLRHNISTIDAAVFQCIHNLKNQRRLLSNIKLHL